MSKIITIPVQSLELVVGQGWKREEKPTEIDVTSLSYVEVSSYVYSEEGINQHDLKLSFTNGTRAITTKENGAAVLKQIAEAADNGLRHKFVQVTPHERILCESQTGIGWNPKDLQMVSVPDFLRQNAP